MTKLKTFICSILILCSRTQISGQDISSPKYERASFPSNTDIISLLRDSSSADIFTSGSVDFPIRISTVRKNAKLIIGGSSTQIYYQGGLVAGIIHLLNTNTFYVRTKGKIPDEGVFYYGSKSFTDTLNIEKKIENVLADKFRFKVSDTCDSSEVWKVRKIDTTKFVHYSLEKHGNDLWSGPDESGENYYIIGFPLSFLYKSIENKAKIAVIGDEYDDNWNNRYHFDNIPYALMSDLDGLNKLLEERYGIKFIKTKVLQKLKLIDFED
jgi:hypothetical protein